MKHHIEVNCLILKKFHIQLGVNNCQILLSHPEFSHKVNEL